MTIAIRDRCVRFEECGKGSTHSSGLCAEHRTQTCAWPGCKERFVQYSKKRYCTQHKTKSRLQRYTEEPMGVGQ